MLTLAELRRQLEEVEAPDDAVVYVYESRTLPRIVFQWTGGSLSLAAPDPD